MKCMAPGNSGICLLAHYEIKQNEFVEAMRKVDPTIRAVASGADPAEMSETGAGKSITGKPTPTSAIHSQTGMVGFSPIPPTTWMRLRSIFIPRPIRRSMPSKGVRAR